MAILWHDGVMKEAELLMLKLNSWVKRVKIATLRIGGGGEVEY